jgi:AraC family transcriptional regulator
LHNIEHRIKSEYRESVLKALHYINQNLTSNLSLEILASIANYSPFHFQKIFSEAINESPKQYIMRLRLEKAAHFLKIYPNLPVVEIGTGCGFSSPSIFSRAFRNYYGVTAESFREMSSNDIALISRLNKKGKDQYVIKESNFWTTRINNPLEKIDNISISPSPVIKKFQSIKIACVQTTLSHQESISFAFKSLMQWAIPNNLASADAKYIGIWLDAPFYTSLDKCRYLAGIEIQDEIKSKRGIDIITLNEGKYATFSMVGNMESTVNHIIALNHKYLDEMGFDIAEIICYEFFDECPANKPYEKINKNILVPVKART